MEYVEWGIPAGAVIVIIVSFVSVIRSNKQMKKGLASQAEAKQRGEKLMAVCVETNELVRELIAVIRDKK